MGTRRNAPSAPSASRPAEESRVAPDVELRQVLPCGSEKSVVRLVELSSGINKGLLHSVLLHLCAHGCTRSPTVRLLLTQALAPASDILRGGVTYSRSASGLARRALEALCHLTALQPKVVPLLLDRSLMLENDYVVSPTPYSGKGKNRADSRSERTAARNQDVGGSHGSTVEKCETNALDKMILRLAASDVLKNAATLELFAQASVIMVFFVCAPYRFVLTFWLFIAAYSSHSRRC